LDRQDLEYGVVSWMKPPKPELADRATASALIAAFASEQVHSSCAVASDSSAQVAREGARRGIWTGFVAVDGGAMWAVQEREPGIVPANTCMLLDPTVTR